MDSAGVKTWQSGDIVMKLKEFFTAVLVVAGLAAPAGAATFIDQNFMTTDSPDSNTTIGATYASVGQVFTVGQSGKLAGVEFNVLKNEDTIGDLTFGIRPLTPGGAPEALATSALASTTINNGDIGVYALPPQSWTSIYVDLSSANIMVSAGDMLSFILSSVGAQRFYVQTDYNSAYAGGARWTQTAANGIFTGGATGADLAFKTYVDISPVPLPAAFPLMLGGLALFGVAARRRKQTA